MTNGEKKMLMSGAAAGTILGIAIGLIIALFVAMKPEPHLLAVYASLGTTLLVVLIFFVTFTKRKNTDA